MSIESGRLYVVVQTLLIENKASKRVVYIQTKQEGDGTVPYPSVSHHTCALDVVTLENAKKKKKADVIPLPPLLTAKSVMVY